MRSLKPLSTCLCLVLALVLSACAQRGQGPANSGPILGTSAEPGSQASSPRSTPPQGGIVEGTINGGGGKGMLCKINGVEKLMALDLWEAEALGLTLLPEPKTEDEALDLAIEVYTRHIWNPWSINKDKMKVHIKKMLKEEFLSKFKYLQEGKSLRLVNDSHEVIKEEGCTPVQIAVYQEATLMIDDALWAKLSHLNKAAMWMHELIYYFERMEGRTNSVTTRILVGQMFSTKGPKPRFEGVPLKEEDRFECTFRDGSVSAGAAFVYAREEKGSKGLEMVFSYLKTANSIMRSSAFFRGLKPHDLMPSDDVNSVEDAALEVDSQASDVELHLIRKDKTLELKVTHRKTNKDLTLKAHCHVPDKFRTQPPKAAPPIEKKAELPIAPPKVPDQVLMISRYGGLGSYETTATYSFRFMTHDVNLTRNNWDMIFEARADFQKDFFNANTVTDDNSFIFTLKSGEKGCAKVDPCEVEKLLHLAATKVRKDTRDEYDRADVKVGQCYLLVSQDSDGAINVSFEVKEHVKSATVNIGQIKVIPKATPRPECK